MAVVWTLIILSARSILISGKRPPAPWYVLLWYAYNVHRHGCSSVKDRGEQEFGLVADAAQMADAVEDVEWDGRSPSRRMAFRAGPRHPRALSIRSRLFKQSVEFSDAFADYFSRRHGILSVRINRTCGSAAISYDAGVLHRTAALQTLHSVSPVSLRALTVRRNGRHPTSDHRLPLALSVAGFSSRFFAASQGARLGF